MRQLAQVAATLLRTFADALCPSPNDTSTPPAPQTSTPTPTPPTAVQAMTEMFDRAMTEMKDLAVTLTMGRQPTAPPTAAPLGMTRTLSGPNYDDDSIPLTPGIEAVLEREAMEDESSRQLAHLRAQRIDLAQQLAKDAEDLAARASPG